MHRHIARLIALSLFALSISIISASAQNNDGIPDNCEYQYAQHYRPNIFPRYEPHNRRLMLVDWNTGADIGVLATDLDDTIIRSWSPTCRYLAVTVTHAASRETNVYDTIDLRLMGSAPNTPSVLNPVSWGPGELLVVEGRAGAMLWNVPQNTQYTLDAGYSPITSRNFNRLRWDTDKGQLTANFAVGGRAIYDLNTGQAVNVTTTRPGEVVFGGGSFACTPTRNARGGARVDGPWLDYALDGGVAYLRHSGETLAILEANIPPTRVTHLGWSINCRYLAAALGSPQQGDTYDTVIWDVLDQRRIGTFPDAHGVPHQLTWDTAEKHVLVETRDGAYLWDLETDARLLVTPETKKETYYCYSTCRLYSFEHIYWDAGREQLLGIPVNTPNAVVAYDVHTGAEVTRYTVDGAATPLDFITSNDSTLLVAYADGQVNVWNRESGVLTTFTTPEKLTSNPYDQFSSRSAISTDNHFLVTSYRSTLWVYELTALNINSTPTYTYTNIPQLSQGVHFINGDTLAANYPYNQSRINVVTGERFGQALIIDPQAQTVQNYTAVPGSSGKSARYRAQRCEQSPRYDRDARQLIIADAQNAERVIETDINPFYSLGISPDCKTIYGKVYRMNRSLPYDTTPPDRFYGYADATELIFWDAATGERLAQIDNGSGAGAIWWNPDGDRAFIHIGSPRNYLIHPASRTLVPVHFQDTDQGWIPSLYNAYWDHNRGVIFIEGFGEVFAIDVQTGAERLRFPALESGRGGCYHSYACGMSFSQDHNWVFVYGDHTLSAWNIDTLTHFTLPVENSRHLSYGAQISPDGRFLIVSRSAVRVWDLANLPEAFEDRLPVMTFGVGADAVMSVRFIDNQTIEVVRRAEDGEGTQTIRYDVLTGLPIT